MVTGTAVAAAAERIAGLVAGRRTMVVGVGNRLRGDDALGPLVAEGLAAEFAGRVIDAGPVPENYLGVLLESAPELVLFVDTADHGAAPGRWCVVPAGALARRGGSTHTASLQLLAQILEAHGIRSWLIGVQPRQLEFGAGVSAAVDEAARELSRALTAALRAGARDA